VAAIVEIADERAPLASEALGLITASFAREDRHPLAHLRSEIAEKRLRLLSIYDFHLLARLDDDADERVTAVAIGVYLAGVNCGFISYLAVRTDLRGRGAGREVRGALIEAFREDARRSGRVDLDAVVGEVKANSPWIFRLVRDRGAIPLDLTYYHPGMTPGASPDPYLLYREPIGDHRRELSALEVRQLIYAVWRRAYRVRYPLEREAFVAMLAETEGRETIGAHPIAAPPHA
jgi:GNAT superfamily N-acetyltransferase